MRIFCVFGGLTALLGCAGFAAADLSADTQNVNFVNNGALAAQESDRVPSGWQLSGGTLAVTSDPLVRFGGQAALAIETDGRGVVKLWQEVDVPPDTLLYFSAWVRADDRVVARVGAQSVSYTDTGHPQKLVGLAQSTADTPQMRIEFELGGWKNAGRTVFHLGDVTLRPAVPGHLPPRKTFGATALARDGQAAACIIYPSGIPVYRELAERIKKAVADHCGVDLDLAADVDVVAEKHPVLKEPYCNSNLILLGRLAVNRAMWPAYNRYLCAADDYYPGGDGYELRTAANVLRNGRNHIIAGGTSEQGAQTAVERLIGRIKKAPVENGSLVLPWMLDVELQGACLAAFQEDDKAWEADPLSRNLPPVEPGYGTVRRWYHNAMGYYWCGWESYRRRAVEMLEPVLRDRSYTHHYIAEFFVRAYDMIDDSDLLTDGQRAAIDSLIQQNFWDDLTGADSMYMITFSPPFDAIKWHGRHPISAWMAELKKADFLHDYFDLRGDVGELVEFRRHEKRRFFDHIVATRWDVSFPGHALGLAVGESEETALLFRYALDNDLYEEFFDSGNAKRSVMVDKLNHVSGKYVRPIGGMDHTFKLGVLASLSHNDDNEVYLALLDKIPLASPDGQYTFMGRYVNGVHRYAYNPGRAAADAALEPFTGVRVPEIMPHNQRIMESFDTGDKSINSNALFDFAAFRGGFGKDDDYLALTGAACSGYPAGVLLDFTSLGRHWLGSNPSRSYLDHNAVSVLRTDVWLEKTMVFPAVATRDWIADLQGGGGVAFTLAPFMDTAWQRMVIRIQPGLYVVRDNIHALQSGKYEIIVNWRLHGWRPYGVARWNGKAWISAQGAEQLRVTPLGTNFGVQGSMRQLALLPLDKGADMSAITVLQAFRPASESACLAALRPQGHIVLNTNRTNTEPVAVVWNPSGRYAGMNSDAGVLTARPEKAGIIHATYFELGGQSIFRSVHPVNVVIDWKAGNVVVDAGTMSASNKITLIGNGAGDAHETGLGAGRNVMDFSGRVQADAWRALVAQLTAEDDACVNNAGIAGIEETNNVCDRTADWNITWTYKGLQRPARIRTVRQVASNIVDLGAAVRLSAIRSSLRFGGPFPSPETMKTAGPRADGKMPALDSADWRAVTNPPVWQPGVRTGNYGRAEPMSERYQAIQFDADQNAVRYVFAEDALGLGYYDANVMRGRQEISLETADLDGDGNPEILAKPHIWPLFHRNRQESDAIAVLRSDGAERFQYDAPVNIQIVRALDLDGSGTRKVVVVGLDARIRIFDADGRLEREMDVYEMHRHFNATEGRPNTRHPAGGFTMPYALGTWRPDQDGARKIIISRYGSFSFLDAAGKFEGVLMSVLGGSYYVNCAMLPYGVDFNQDGVEEQVCLGRDAIIHLSGEPVPTVREPHRRFYPQVYSADYLRDPRSSGGSQVDGTPVFAFDLLSWGEGALRYIMVIRGDYLAIYDALAKKWIFQWAPLAEISSAAVVSSESDHLRVIAVTADGLMWQLDWRDRLDRLADFKTRFLGDWVRKISASPALAPGCALLAGRRGLYLQKDFDCMEKITDEPCHDAVFLPDGNSPSGSMIMARDDGEIARLDRRNTSPGQNQGLK